jgi:hypothetical protein
MTEYKVGDYTFTEKPKIKVDKAQRDANLLKKQQRRDEFIQKELMENVSMVIGDYNSGLESSSFLLKMIPKDEAVNLIGKFLETMGLQYTKISIKAESGRWKCIILF